VGRGVRAIVLTNQNGAVLELTGRQVGLIGECRFERSRNHDEVSRVLALAFSH